MAHDRRFTVTTLSVSGARDPSGATGTRVEGVRMAVTVWTGAGSTDQRPRVVVDESADFTVPAVARSVTVDLRHGRYAPLTIALVRDAGETVWRWTEPNRVVGTTGRPLETSGAVALAAPADGPVSDWSP